MIRDFLEGLSIYLACLIGALIVIISIIFISIWLFSITPTGKDFEARHTEWQNKVNNCVMDMNSRPDCKLIIYKDNQNHNKNHSTVMPVVMPIVH